MNKRGGKRIIGGGGGSKTDFGEGSYAMFSPPSESAQSTAIAEKREENPEILTN